MANKIYAVKLAVAAGILLFTPAIMQAATCSVNAGATHQVIRGFGGSNAWSDCTSCLPGSAKNAWFTAAKCDQLFTTAGNGIGLSIIRMRIPPDASQNGAAIGPVQSAVARGAIVMATEWSPPASWKSNAAVDNQNGGYLLAANYQNYANYLRDFVNAMKNTYNITIDTLSPANEPDWMVGYDGCTWSGAQLRDFVKNNLGPTFTTAGLTTKLTVGESYANAFSITDPTLNDTTASGYIDTISVHTYGGGPTAYPAASAKDYWMTERADFNTYDGSITNGLMVAGWLHNGLVNAGYNAWIYWWIASDSTNEGLTTQTKGDPKRLFVMGNYSKFIRPGYIRIDATAAPTGGITASAYKEPSGASYVIVCTNTNASATSMTFNLTGISAASFTPYITSSSYDLAAQAAVPVSANSFTYNIPAQCVVSFVGSGGPVNTPTITPTNSATASRTLTYTYTRTPSNTFTNTLVNTPTYTYTVTRTNTPTNTLTGTFVSTFTYTGTCTRTPVNTATGTNTITPPPTSTNTPVNTPTYTATKTNTQVNTATNTLITTPTGTPAGTLTDTPVVTLTNTPLNTATSTATVTATSSMTNTPVNTYTNTVAATLTSTPQGTLTGTPVVTLTNTRVNTATTTSSISPTLTFTVTPTWTRTLTYTYTLTMTPSFTPSGTRTQQPTNTCTATPTLAPSGRTAIEDVIIYPNPVPLNSDLKLLVRISGCPAEINFRLYTAGFRLVMDKTWKTGFSYPVSDLSVPASYLSKLANGSYYYVLSLTGCDRTKAQTRKGVLLMLR